MTSSWLPTPPRRWCTCPSPSVPSASSTAFRPGTSVVRPFSWMHAPSRRSSAESSRPGTILPSRPRTRTSTCLPISSSWLATASSAPAALVASQATSTRSARPLGAWAPAAWSLGLPPRASLLLTARQPCSHSSRTKCTPSATWTPATATTSTFRRWRSQTSTARPGAPSSPSRSAAWPKRATRALLTSRLMPRLIGAVSTSTTCPATTPGPSCW
mmetsp:Transcript_104906/g.266421  ORF Transcript_104906/g.266421 Transcript_104906/m.266421 type:complete len:215 (-) Transcript_104906:691-1335(-)